MKLKMLATHRELKFGTLVAVPEEMSEARARALVDNRLAEVIEEAKEKKPAAKPEPSEPELATAEPKAEKAVSVGRKRK